MRSSAAGEGLSASSSRTHRLLSRLVAVQEDEVDALLHGFAAFFCLLGAYFLVLPLRDNAGVALGPEALPLLFVASFGLTLLATPLATFALTRPGIPKERAVQQLYRALAAVLLGFFLLYALVLPPAAAVLAANGSSGSSGRAGEPLLPLQELQQTTSSSRLQPHPGKARPHHRDRGSAGRAVGDTGAGLHRSAAEVIAGPGQHSIWSIVRQGFLGQPGRLSEPGKSSSVQPGGAAAHGLGSTASDGSENTGSGALAGGKQTDRAAGRQQRRAAAQHRELEGPHDQGGVGRALAQLPDIRSVQQQGAAAALLGGSAADQRRHHHAALDQAEPGVTAAAQLDRSADATLQLAAGGAASVNHDSPAAHSALPQQGASSRRAVLAAFFLWVSVMNSFTASALWARMADTFSPAAATRLFGFLGAGATVGQFVGSVVAAVYARTVRRYGATHHWAGGEPAVLILLAAAGLEVAGRLVVRMNPALRPRRKLSDPTQAAEAVSRDFAPGGGERPLPMLRHSASHTAGKQPAGGKAKVAPGEAEEPEAPTNLSRLWEGFQLIWRSSYLLHLCAHLVLGYLISSFFYFQKSMIVGAAVRDAGARTAFFASINALSALVIAALQIAATGRLLRQLGVPAALLASPLAGGALLAGLAAWPAPRMVTVAEVTRKVVTYTLARPAREVLFTVASRRQLYAAKPVLDTLVLRAGDLAAAALFHLLTARLHLGSQSVALAAVPLALAWAAVAFSLGVRQQRLATLTRKASDLPSIDGRL